MLHREIITVCSLIHTKHINTLRGQNVELLNVKLAVHTARNFPLIEQSPYVQIEVILTYFSENVSTACIHR